MRVLGLPIATPQAVIDRMLLDLSAISRVARAAPVQLERLLELGEEIVSIGRSVRAITERLDERAEAIMELGERLDKRAAAIMELGERLDARAEALLEMGATIEQLGGRIDTRGGEIVEGAAAVVQTGGELIAVLPTLERALDMATPLEGAIDRFGRLVDRLPGGSPRRRPESRGPRLPGGPSHPEDDGEPEGDAAAQS